MFIDAKGHKRLNSIFLFLKKQSPKYFEYTGIVKCEECAGTGLYKYKYMDKNDASWETNNFCEECNGVGFIGLCGEDNIDEMNFVCNNCNGNGCEKCKHNGVIDWISNIMGVM